jgi:folate-binding protein YgfZ
MTLAEAQRDAGARRDPRAAVPADYGDPAGELAAAAGAVALVDLSHRGRLRVSGSRRLDYLHRVTAQAFLGLAPGTGVAASVLERTGKMVEVLTAHAFDDHLLLLTSAANRERACEWLRRFVFREDARIDDRSAETGQLLLLGPHAPGVAAALAGAGPALLPPHAWAPLAAFPAGALIRAPWPGEAFWLIAESPAMRALWETTLAAGRGDGIRPAGLAAYEALRVLAGVPDGGAEIDEQANPLELGLEGTMSLTKGCFTGQEAIAKMVTHRAVRRRLIGLEVLDGPLPGRGAPLVAGSEAVGRVTTAVEIPGGRRVGLALCRHEHAAPGTRLRSGDAEARVSLLPFPGDLPAAE